MFSSCKPSTPPRAVPLAVCVLTLNAFAAPHAVDLLERLAASDSEGARFARTLDVASQTTLARDGVVVLTRGSDGGAHAVRAAVFFNRPIDDVYAVLSHAENQAKYLPHLTASRPVGVRTADGQVVDFVVSAIVPLKFRTRLHYSPRERRIEWQLDSSEVLKEQAGSWQLYPFGDQTIAEYKTRLSLRDGPLESLRSLGEREEVEKALAATRRYVESTAAQ